MLLRIRIRRILRILILEILTMMRRTRLSSWRHLETRRRHVIVVGAVVPEVVDTVVSVGVDAKRLVDSADVDSRDLEDSADSEDVTSSGRL